VHGVRGLERIARFACTVYDMSPRTACDQQDAVCHLRCLYAPGSTDRSQPPSASA
jgi:hypothetical protein